MLPAADPPTPDLRTSDLDYDLPPGRVATHPASPRDAARLMVVDRAAGTVEHRRVGDLAGVLRRGDLLVTNESRVLPARFRGVNIATGGQVEGLYLRDHVEPGGPAPGPCWVAMLKARRFRAGARVRLHTPAGEPSDLLLTLLAPGRDDPSTWIVGLSHEAATLDTPRSALGTVDVLSHVGLPPIPPYILGARRDMGEATLAEGDPSSYQTVFAGGLRPSGDGAEVGSVAAPTAGLHFTPGLLDRLGEAGVERAGAVLHVGPGTFKPVEVERVQDHPMHAEWCSIPPDARASIASARARGGRVIGVGTTAARTLEAFAAEPEPGPEWLHTRLLICPGHVWKRTDGLLTNFHLPRSTLMALVAAMLPGGVDELKGLYAQAIEHGYRFYSYGDAMLIV